MDAHTVSKKRKPDASTQDIEPGTTTKRKRTIKAEPMEKVKQPVATAQKASSRGSISARNSPRRKAAAGARAGRTQKVTEMTGSTPSRSAARNLTLDPDGHRDKMIRNDPTDGFKPSTRASISKQPKKRPGPKIKSSQQSEQTPPTLPTPVDANNGEDSATHEVKAIDEGPMMDTTVSTRGIEQLLTPASTQAHRSPDDNEESNSSPASLPQFHDTSVFQEPDEGYRTPRQSRTACQAEQKGLEQLSSFDIGQQDTSDDELSSVPSDLSDQSPPVLRNAQLGYPIERSTAHPTNFCAGVIDGTEPLEPYTSRGSHLQGGAEVSSTHLQPEITIPQDHMLVPGDLSSLEQVDGPRSRSRRSVRPIMRYGQLVGTDVALNAVKSLDLANESPPRLECSAKTEQDDYDMDQQDNHAGSENEEEIVGPTRGHITTKTKRKGRTRGLTTPAPKRRLKDARPRAVDPGRVILKVMSRSLSTLLQRGSPEASRKHHSTEYTAAVIDESSLDPRLLALSKKLSYREALGQKPRPSGKPEVWADSRQALCETVPYFRMPQSGCHQNDRHVYSFLFDGTGHCREYMDNDVVISRAGGGMEADSGGKMVQKKHHLMSESQVQSVLNDIEYQNPVVIIAGNHHEGTICRMPHRYNVLGWYKPVAVWAEKTLGKGGRPWTTIKYRFERLNTTTTPWYAPKLPSLTEEEHSSVGPLDFNICSQCNTRFPVTYLEGWMCLNPECDQFWKLSNGEDAPCGRLFYHPAFLLTRTPWLNEQEPFSVRPPVPNIQGTAGENLTYINTRGICCPQCGRCSSRRLFKGWKCDNPSCDYQSFPKHIPVTAAMLHSPWDGVGDNIGDGPALAKNKHEKEQGVQVAVSHRLGYKIYTYTFSGIDGSLVHAVSNNAINKRPRGPDEMFDAMQHQDDPGMDLYLERRRFNGKWLAPTDPSFLATFQRIQEADHRRAPDVEISRRESFLSQLVDNSVTIVGASMSSDSTRQVGEAAAEAQAENESGSDVQPGEEVAKAVEDDGDLMTAFSINYGMPYKFVASGASLPFSNAPWPIRACRADLNWASKNFLSSKGHQELNELLIFAYLQGQKIEYHDDGESGLGPRISTLSLGGKAKMHLRMKQKHYVGCSKSGIFNAERPVPGGIGGPEMYQKRMEAWQELQDVRADKSTYERRRKEIPKELGLPEKRFKKAGDLVTITLNHGDIVLMEGYEIQQYLEHKVVPEGCLRFALTCRTVLPEHLKAEEQPKYEVGPHDPSISSLYHMDDEEQRKVGSTSG